MRYIMLFVFCFLASMVSSFTIAKGDHFPSGTQFVASFFCDTPDALKFYWSMSEENLSPIPLWVDCWDLGYAHPFLVLKYIERSERRDGLPYEIYEAVDGFDFEGEGKKYYTFYPLEDERGA